MSNALLIAWVWIEPSNARLSSVMVRVAMLSASRDFVFEALDLENGKGPLPMGLPAPLTRQDIPQVLGASQHFVQYIASPKADGDREFCGWYKWKEKDNQPVAFRVNRKGTTRKLLWELKGCDSIFAGTLLDTEIITSNGITYIWIFDVIQVNGHKIRTFSYEHRLAGAIALLRNQTNLVPFPVKPERSVLPFHNFVKANENVYVAVKPIWNVVDLKYAAEWASKMAHIMPGDGIIFTPKTKAVAIYRAVDVFKWKPAEKQTADFCVRMCNVANQVDLFVTDEKHQMVHYARVPLVSDIEVMHDRIYECRFDANRWVVTRERPDKDAPNAKVTVDCTIQCIKEAIELHELFA